MIKRLLDSVDAIFLYQFVVYLFIWLWGLHLVITDPEGWHFQGIHTFVIAPPVVLAGYLIRKRWGVYLCAAGDAVMAFCVGLYAHALVRPDGWTLAAVLTAALSLCMLVRCLRDLMLIFGGEPDGHEVG